MQESILKVLAPSDAFLLLELIDNCVHCRNSEKLETIVNKLKKLLHFNCLLLTHLNYSSLIKKDAGSATTNNFGFPEEFLGRYFQKKLYADDVPVLAFFNTFKLQNWTESIKQYNSGAPTAADQELKDYGLCNGWVYGVRDINRVKITTISIGAEYSENSDRNKAIIRLFTPHIAKAYKRILKVRDFNKYHLTKREVEVLNWLKQGKTSWEISMILKISERCVNFHINNAKNKLDSVNRTQAVAVALGENLITL